MMMVDDPHSQPTAAFATEARQVIQELRGALGSVIERVSGDPNVRPSRLADALILDNRLAWKISKVVSTRDPFLASQYVPGSKGLRIFLRAAAKKDVADEVLTAAQVAFDRFRTMMKLHASDRTNFESLLAGQVSEDPARVDLQHRKGAFQHLSYIWGVQARAHLHTYIIRASEDQRRIDAATLRGYIDLRWIRPNVPWRLSRFYTVDDAGDRHTRFDRQPLAPTASGGAQVPELPLLTDFCSQPLPRIRRVDGPRGDVCYQLVEGAVGNTGSLTCVLGEVIRGAEPRFRQPDHRELVMVALPRTPCETLLFDIIIHRDVLERVDPRAEMFSDLFDRAFDERPAAHDRLPLHARVAHLGSGPAVVSTPDVPRYREMVRYAMKQLAWPEDEFDVYRLQVRYPPIPTAVRLVQELPEPPAAEPRMDT